jgi:hypothetical protein
MKLLSPHVSSDVAERQLTRYRQMTATEKLECADALWDLAWDATQAGVRMRHPGLTATEVTRAARLAFDRASD